MADIEIKFISPRATSELVGLSTREIARKAAAGKLPSPLKLGEGRNGRTAFIAGEIEDWQRARIAERDNKVAA